MYTGQETKKVPQNQNVVSTNSYTELVTGVAILIITSRIILFQSQNKYKKENDCKVIISAKSVYKNLYPKIVR